jgi:hypothetical protein
VGFLSPAVADMVALELEATLLVALMATATELSTNIERLRMEFKFVMEKVETVTYRYHSVTQQKLQPQFLDAFEPTAHF